VVLNTEIHSIVLVIKFSLDKEFNENYII